jgi:hypothetical protein
MITYLWLPSYQWLQIYVGNHNQYDLRRSDYNYSYILISYVIYLDSMFLIYANSYLARLDLNRPKYVYVKYINACALVWIKFI